MNSTRFSFAGSPSLASMLAMLMSLPVTAAEVKAVVDRTILPFAEPAHAIITELDAHKVKTPARFEIKAPAGAPNVLIVLLDDIGFAQSSAFGGPIHMPTVEKLANAGLRYNQFHTTALCSPTRVTLLTGRNHHMNNMGSITETATAFQGNTGIRPNSITPLAEILRLNGYSTAAFGKYHETPTWENSVSGPSDRWPTHSGFDKFYGFIGRETNQWAPLLVDNMARVGVPHDPNYHFMTDMTNQSINWLRTQKALTPDRPFFIYFAPGAMHAPHQVPKEWIAKYKGHFDMGWDKLREQALGRQKKLGIVPADTRLAPKPEAIKDWDKLSGDEKKLFARQMEVYAGFAEMADTETGRLIDAIEKTGQLDNTLVIYIVGDNGASAEGGMNGVFNESSYFNGVSETVPDILKHYDELGGPMSYGHYAAGWAVAGDTPFTWTKQIAASYGGTRNGMVMFWPRRIHARGELRSQWHHVVDIAPTVLEAAGLPDPKVVKGTVQTPMQGVSIAYTWDDAKAPDRHTTQYFEIIGNRAIYNDGWLAGTVHKAPWEMKPRHPLADDIWELYDTRKDFSLRNNLAAKEPEKLRKLQGLFMSEAARNHALPIDDRSIERLNAAIAGRPDLMGARTSLTVYPGMTGMSENVFINIKNRSHKITAEIEVPAGTAAAQGVILAQAGRFGGWSLYMQDGNPMYTYNYLGLERFTVASVEKLPAGKATLLFDFEYDGGGMGKGGTGALYVNGQKVGQGRIDKTQPLIFSADEGADVGMDGETPVTEAYASPFLFTGKISQVTIDVKPIGAGERQAEDTVKAELEQRQELAD